MTTDDPKGLQAAYNELLQELERAKHIYEQGDRVRARADAVTYVLMFLQANGVGRATLRPLEDLNLKLLDEDLKSLTGRKPKKTYAEMYLMAHAAAAVTALKKERGLRAALDDVSRASGLDKKKLETHRNNILRGAFANNELVETAYQEGLTEILNDWRPQDRRRLALQYLAEAALLIDSKDIC